MASKGARVTGLGGESKQTGKGARRLSAISRASAEGRKADHGADDREVKGNSYLAEHYPTLMRDSMRMKSSKYDTWRQHARQYFMTAGFSSTPSRRPGGGIPAHP